MVTINFYLQIFTITLRVFAKNNSSDLCTVLDSCGERTVSFARITQQDLQDQVIANISTEIRTVYAKT